MIEMGRSGIDRRSGADRRIGFSIRYWLNGGVERRQWKERRSEIERRAINEIIKGKASITPETAFQLELVLGVPAGFWNNREKAYREALARKEEQKRLEKQVQWLAELPIRAMIKLGWIKSFQSKTQQIQEALNFFGVASAEQGRKLISKYNEQYAAFRKSVAFQREPAAVAAWLRKGEIEAQRIICAAYHQNKFKETLNGIRSLTIESPKVFLPQLIKLCADAGVAVVFVPELPKTRASGATRWLTPRKALVQLSFRYKSNDQFWFTFYHESAHIVLQHSRKAIILEDIQIDSAVQQDEQDEEANRYAANLLIPQQKFNQFVSTQTIDEGSIIYFARQLGIAPGILVGRLQHDKILPHSHFNGLKIRLTRGIMKKVNL